MSKHRLFVGMSAAAVALAAVAACVGDEPAVTGADNDAGPGDTPPAGDGGPGNTGGPADAGPGDTGAPADADAGSRYCDTRVAAPGVTDFFCADFDEADPFAGWTGVEHDDGGTLETTTVVLTSPPSSLVANSLSSPNNSTPIFGGGALTWSKAGAKTVAQIALQAKMNPTVPGGVVAPTTGSTTLLKVATSDFFASLNWTRGGFVGGTSGYIGYFLEVETSGGAAALVQYALTDTGQQLQPGVWTNVQLVYITSGTLKLIYDGITVFSKTGTFTTTQTSASGTVGQVGSGVVSFPTPMRYDDVEVSITRAP